MQLLIEQKLQSKNIPFRLIELKANAYTVEDVVNNSAGEIRPDEICKTIILRGKKTDKKYAVLLKGLDKLNFSGAKKYFGEEVTIATSQQVVDAADVEPGAVCPLLLNIPLFVDSRVLVLYRMNCGSGHHLYGLEVEIEALKKLTNFTQVQLAKASHE